MAYFSVPILTPVLLIDPTSPWTLAMMLASWTIAIAVILRSMRANEWYVGPGRPAPFLAKATAVGMLIVMILFKFVFPPPRLQ
jgi:hypothetical protein